MYFCKAAFAWHIFGKQYISLLTPTIKYSMCVSYQESMIEKRVSNIHMPYQK